MRTKRIERIGMILAGLLLGVVLAVPSTVHAAPTTPQGPTFVLANGQTLKPMGVTSTGSPLFGDPIQSDYAYSTCSEEGGASCEWFYGPIAYTTGYTYMDIGTSSYFGAAQINGRVGYYGEPGAFTESWWTNVQFVWYVDFQDVLVGTPCFFGTPDYGNLSDKEQGLVYSFSESAIVGGTQTNVLDHHSEACGLGSGSWSESGYFYTTVETMCFEAGNTYQLQSWMNVNDVTGAIGETAGATSDMGTGSYFAELITMNFWTSGNC